MELLKHHGCPGIPTCPGQLELGRTSFQQTSPTASADLYPIDRNRAAINLFEGVNSPEQSAFASTTGAHDAGGFSIGEGHGQIIQNHIAAKRLGDISKDN